MPFGSDILDTGTETDASDIQADIALLPALAEGVNARVKTFSVGLDPMHEQTAAEWFESLGYRTLTGDVKYVKGYWGGTRAEADPRLGRGSPSTPPLSNPRPLPSGKEWASRLRTLVPRSQQQTRWISAS